MSLSGKIALITGGTGGIGKSIAKKFLNQGAEIIISGRDSKKLDAVVKDLGNGMPILFDIKNDDEVKDGIKKIIEKFGRIDILVNNAGVHPKPKPLHEIEESEWNHVIDINLTGQFRVTKEVIPHMIKNGGGSIINISSDAGLRVFENYQADAYTASKAALVLLTKSWALEYANKKIRVNCVCPGTIDTDMAKPFLDSEIKKEMANTEHPLGRIGKPDDVANAVLFLASEDSSWTTGSILVIDGGSSLK